MTSALDRAYRRELAAARQRVVAEVERLYGEEIDEAAIADSFAAFVRRAVPVIEAGQSVAQELAAAYLDALSGALEERQLAAEVVGTTRQGKTIAEALDPFSSMMLATIAAAGADADPIGFGLSLATGMADREVTAAADRETEARASADGWRWQGIVNPNACGECQANAGVHDASEPIFRHNDCSCDRQWIPPAAA